MPQLCRIGGLIGGGGAGGFSPMSLGVTAWYSAKEVALGAVSQWNDLSGNGYHVTQGTGAKQPTATANQINGRPALLFDNGDTLLTTTATGLFSICNGPNTIFVVAKRNTEAGVVDQIYTMTEAGSGRNYIKFSATSGQVNFISRSADANLATVTGATNTNYQILMGRRSGTTQAISFNGGAETTNANGLDEPGVDAMYIGSRADVDSFLDGGLASIIMFNYSLSTDERALMHSYLGNEWGITVA